MKSETELAEDRRRRQYRITARLLREYTTRLNRIGDHLSSYLDSAEAVAPGGSVPSSVVRAMWRVAAINLPFRDLTLTASQMLVHFDLGEAEKAELALRFADAQDTLVFTRLLSDQISERYNIVYPLRDGTAQNSQPPVPRSGVSPLDRKPPLSSTGLKPRT